MTSDYCLADVITWVTNRACYVSIKPDDSVVTKGKENVTKKKAHTKENKKKK